MEAQEEVNLKAKAAGAETRAREKENSKIPTQEAKGKSGKGLPTTPSAMGEGVKAPGGKTAEDEKRRDSSPGEGKGKGDARVNGRGEGLKNSNKSAAVSSGDAVVGDGVEDKAMSVRDTHDLNAGGAEKERRKPDRRLAERALALEAERGRAKLATFKRGQGSFGSNTAEAEEKKRSQEKQLMEDALVEMAERERVKVAEYKGQQALRIMRRRAKRFEKNARHSVSQVRVCGETSTETCDVCCLKLIFPASR